MCLGLPGTVLEVRKGSDVAQVNVSGVVRDVNIGLLDDAPAPGDHVLVHSGFALERMTEEEWRDAEALLGDTAGPG
jgi:hydrogenase expression/formation protein HypC